MRVLLIQAPSVEGQHAEIVAPLGMGAVAAAARAAGHEVTLLDLNLELDRPKALCLALESGPQVVGVGLRNIDPLANRRHSYLPEFAAVLDMVRAVLPAVPLVGGGPGFSMFAREIMQRYSALDIGVVLEGERTFPAVLGALARGGPAVVAGMPGTLVRTPARRPADPAGTGPGADARDGCDAEVVAGRPRPRLGRDELDAVRTWLPALATEYAGRTAYAPAAGVETKRGCPLRCSYCVYPALQGRRLRYRSPTTVVAEVELLWREAGLEWVHFTDPVLNYPAGHFREVCRALIARKRPVRWTGFFREDVLTKADAELAVRAGCAAFQFSSDGTCDATLARLRKGLALRDVLRAAAHVAATDALTVYHFMVNVPGTDAEVARGAGDLVERLHDLHVPRANLGAIVFNNLRVYPGTTLAAELAAAGELSPDTDLLYPTYYDPAPFRDLRYRLEEGSHRRTWRSLRAVGGIPGLEASP